MVYENYSIDSHCKFCSESFAPTVPIPLDHRRHLSEMFIQPWKSIPLLLSIFFFSKEKTTIYVIFVSFISDAWKMSTISSSSSPMERIHWKYGNRKCKVICNVKNDFVKPTAKRRKKRDLCMKRKYTFFFVTSNQFIIICLASDFHSLCHWFSRDFRKPSQLDEFGSNTFIANTFYMNGHWLASGYAACATLYVVFFSFFLLFSISTYD